MLWICIFGPYFVSFSLGPILNGSWNEMLCIQCKSKSDITAAFHSLLDFMLCATFDQWCSHCALRDNLNYLDTSNIHQMKWSDLSISWIPPKYDLCIFQVIKDRFLTLPVYTWFKRMFQLDSEVMKPHKFLSSMLLRVYAWIEASFFCHLSRSSYSIPSGYVWLEASCFWPIPPFQFLSSYLHCCFRCL